MSLEEAAAAASTGTALGPQAKRHWPSAALQASFKLRSHHYAPNPPLSSAGFEPGASWRWASLDQSDRR